MSLTLFRCQGGELVLPDLVLVGRLDGGNLCVNPPRPVWERSELSPSELTLWSFLVAASGKAMLATLPQLKGGGCINYWEAGNWALNVQAAPAGPKHAPTHRSVHLHLLGRSPTASDPDWRWGEAPRFPDFADRLSWAAGHQRLNAQECQLIVIHTQHLLETHYGISSAQIQPWSPCSSCGYPTPHAASPLPATLCGECQS